MLPPTPFLNLLNFPLYSVAEISVSAWGDRQDEKYTINIYISWKRTNADLPAILITKLFLALTFLWVTEVWLHMIHITGVSVFVTLIYFFGVLYGAVKDNREGEGIKLSAIFTKWPKKVYQYHSCWIQPLHETNKRDSLLLWYGFHCYCNNKKYKNKKKINVHIWFYENLIFHSNIHFCLTFNFVQLHDWLNSVCNGNFFVL